MPPFQPKACVPVPAPTLPSAMGPSSAAQGFPHVGGPHRVGPHVVYPAIVRFPHDRVDGVLSHAWLVVQPIHEAPGSAPDAKGAGEHDGRPSSPNSRTCVSPMSLP